MDVIQDVGAYAGFAAVVGLAVLSALYFSQARDLRRLREWAGRAPERAAEQAAQGIATPEQAAQDAARPAASGAVRPIPAAKPAAQKPEPGAKPEPAATPGPVAPGKAPAPVGKPATAAAAAPATASGPAAATAAGPAPATPAGAPAKGKPGEPAKAPDGAPAPAKPDGGPAAKPDGGPAPAKPPEAPKPVPAAGGPAPATPPPRPSSPPVLPARPAPPVRSPAAAPVSQSTAVLPASSTRLRDRAGGAREGLSPRYIALIVAGVIVVGGGAVFGISQLGGDDEATTSGDRSDAPQEPVNPSLVTVSVLNGTTVPGLAAQIGDEIETAGFQRGNVANALDQQRTTSTVLFAPGKDREARVVARKLDITTVEPVDPDSAALGGNASVVVIVGADQTQ